MSQLILPATDVLTASDDVAKTFPFTVDMKQLYGPQGEKTDLYGLFRSDTGEQIADASKKKGYVGHTTDDVVVLTEVAQSVFKGDHVTKCRFRKGHHVELQPSDEHRKAIFGQKDNIFPRLHIDASYNGKSHVTTLGLFRDACRNLEMLSMVNGVSVRIRHSGNLRREMNKLIDDISRFVEGWDNIVAHVVAMEAMELNLHDYLNIVYPKPDDGATTREISIRDNIVKKIKQRVTLEGYRTGRVDPEDLTHVSGWLGYNGVQGHLLHDASRAKNTTPFDRFLKMHTGASLSRINLAERTVFDMVG